MKRVFSVLAVSFCLVCCVTPARQTETLLASPGKLPSTYLIENVEFIDQSAGYCGPATLTMALRWAGKAVTVAEIAPQVFTPGFNGSLQTDLVSASRRQAMMAVRIEGLHQLLTEVAAGHPVIIFENLSLSWAPQWHYALVLGFDLVKQEIILHSGHDPYFHWDLSKFERSWMLGEYWGLVILPPGELAASAGELANVTAAVGLEQAQKMPEAEKSYRKVLEKWPTSLVALIGLANIMQKNGKKSEAVSLLKIAVKNHPDSKAAQHNLTVAQEK